MATMLPRTLLALCLLLTACKPEKIPPLTDERAKEFKAFNDQANILCGKLAYREALAAYQSALALCDRDTYPLPWSTTAKDVAWTHRQLSEHDKAQDLYREILAQNEKSIGTDSPETADTIDCLVTVLYQPKDHTEAESLLRRLVTIREKILAKETLEELNSGIDSRRLSSSLDKLGVFLKAQREWMGSFQAGERLSLPR